MSRKSDEQMIIGHVDVIHVFLFADKADLQPNVYHHC